MDEVNKTEQPQAIDLPDMQDEGDQAKNKRHITATFFRDDPEDQKLIRQYERLIAVGGFNPKDIFQEGIKVCLHSAEYKAAIQEANQDII